MLVEDESLDVIEEIPEEAPELNFEVEPEEVTTEPEDEIPEKYQGKSVQDIARMHQEAEKLLGRQSSEVGELRKVVDSYITNQLAPKAPAEEVPEVDFFDDPQKAVAQAIENHPKIREAEQVNANYRKQTAMSEIQSKHPDMGEIVADPAFGEWIGASKIRTQLYQNADQGFDSDAADELLTNWKERKGIVAKTLELEKATRKEAVKKASTGNARGTGETSRKVYRRTDIIKLMQTDPDRYEANADEIMQAYADGRVK
jgi:hypothetical protein